MRLTVLLGELMTVCNRKYRMASFAKWELTTANRFGYTAGVDSPEDALD